MKYLKSFESNKYNDIIKYLEICFIDVIDEFGIYSEDNINGIHIDYYEDDINIMFPFCMDRANIINIHGNILYNNINQLEENLNFGLKIKNYIEEGLDKFKIRYDFTYNIIEVSNFLKLVITI